MWKRWAVIVTLVMSAVGSALNWWTYGDFVSSKLPPGLRDDPWLHPLVSGPWLTIAFGIGGIVMAVLEWRSTPARGAESPTDPVLLHVDQGGLERLPDLLDRGESLLRASARAREIGVAAHWQEHKRRWDDVAAWNEDIVRSLPSHAQAEQRWLASLPPRPARGDIDAYVGERLTLLRRILQREAS